MPYTINRTDGTTLVTLADGVVDTTTDLQLVGRNVAGYGEIQNENFVRLLENFGSTTAPSKAQVGQLWFDKTVNSLRPAVFDGTQWRQLGIVQVSATEPSNRKEGDLWWDSAKNQLYAWSADGDNHVLVGPEDLISYSVTKWVSMVLTDTSAVDHPVTVGYINNVAYAVIADTEFTIDQTATPLPNFTKCYRGTVLKGTNANGVSTDTKNHGTATDADRLVGKAGDTYANREENEIITGVFNFQNNDGINVGPNNELKINVDSVSGNAGINNETNDVLSFGVNYTGSGADKTVFYVEGKDVKPYADNQVNLGAPTMKYRNIYADAIYSNVVGDALGNFSGTLTGAVTGNVTGNVTGTVTGPTIGTVKATGGKIIVNNDLQIALTTAGRDGEAGNYEGYFDGTAKYVVDGVYRTNNQTISGSKTFSATQNFNAAVNVNHTLSADNVNITEGTIGSNGNTTRLQYATIDNSDIEDTNIIRATIDNGSTIDNSALGTIGILSNVKSTKFTDSNDVSFKFISKDGTFGNSDHNTVVTQLAIKQYVDEKVGAIPKDLTFHLDTRDMDVAAVKAQLNRVAPASEYASGTKARILGSYYYSSTPVGQFYRRYGTNTGVRYGIGYIGGRSYSYTGVRANVTDVLDAKSAITGYEFVKKGTGLSTTTNTNVVVTDAINFDFLDSFYVTWNPGLSQLQADYIGLPQGAGATVVVWQDGVIQAYGFDANAVSLDGIKSGIRVGRGSAFGSATLQWFNVGADFASTPDSVLTIYEYDITKTILNGSWEFVGNF